MRARAARVWLKNAVVASPLRVPLCFRSTAKLKRSPKRSRGPAMVAEADAAMHASKAANRTTGRFDRESVRH
jgi:hypothetical protein